MADSIMTEIENVKGTLEELEARVGELGFDTKQYVTSSVKKAWRSLQQPSMLIGMYTALCVDTQDPLQRGRVRFWSPFLYKMDTQYDEVDWALPISAMGGFDDCGMTWVPPAGSTLVLFFERGARSSPYYIGTTFSSYRGPENDNVFNIDMREYYKIHAGHRKGYMVGANDESQVYQPWNTENHNAFTHDTMDDFNRDVNAKENMTYPHIYGFKTPQKHYIKMDDGNYKCNHKYKRFEIMSSCGGFMIFKDDHLHPAIQVCNPTPNQGSNSPSDQYKCNDKEGNPLEKTECPPSTDMSEQPMNPYFKCQSEQRAYYGHGTPQNNKIDLKQSGWQVLSHSGHTIRMDDSVDEPQGVPEWEQAMNSFDFGCNDKYVGKTNWESATGHIIEMSDKESDTKIRGKDNYIRLLSALGNKVELNDETTSQKMGGPNRGIHIQSTSNHTIDMVDEENEQGQNSRTGQDMGQDIPNPKSKKAYIRVRSGYGLQISLNDCMPGEAAGSQEKTVNQHIQIFCPQKDNKVRGPHLMHFQEMPEGPGQVLLRVGGDYVCATYDNHVTVVGDKDKNPSNKITEVSQHTVIQSEQWYWNVAQNHALLADQKIYLMAGKDCIPKDPGPCQPCVWPVICLSPKGLTISDRVYVSASPDAKCVSWQYLLAGAFSCTPWQKCTGGGTV